jgi:hypothetical protein
MSEQTSLAIIPGRINSNELRNMSVVEIGYELYVETTAAMKWLTVNRPNIYRSIVKEDQSRRDHRQRERQHL